MNRRGVAIMSVVALMLAFAAPLLFPGKALLLNEIAILALFVMSLDLILGFAGIVSLGHAAFLGLGAYAAALLAKAGYGDPLLGLCFGMAVAALAGFVTSFLVLRGADLTRLMVTLGIAMSLYELANRMAWLTGGADGLSGFEVKPLLGVFEFDLNGRVACFYSLSVLALCFALCRRLLASPFGFALRAIRDNRLRAEALGIPVNRRLIAVYTLSAATAGAAGVLQAQTSQFVSLSLFDFHRSAEALLALVIGGAGTLYGALIGAALFRLLQDVLSRLSPQHWEFFIGFILVMLVLVGHERLRATLAKLAQFGRGTPR
jgi:branched-chain amino acid transport system permease protein